jgi:D-alanine transaminase
MRPLGMVNGEIIDINTNVVPMEDRGHQFGDGVYEVTRVYNGKCFALKQHIDRMYRSLRELRIPAIYTFQEIAEFHERLIQESGVMEGGVYLQITRGIAPRAHNFPENTVPHLTMSIRPIGTSTALAAVRENGAKVMMIPDERWLRCDIKSLNLLGNILGKQKAKEAGCFEAVMLRDGYVTEGTSSNFLIVRDGVLWSHPVNNLILKGVTRTLVVEKIAPELGIPVIEKAFDAEFAKGAAEAFLSGTTTEIAPVISIDGASVGTGQVGPITRKIQQAYGAMIDVECGR